MAEENSSGMETTQSKVTDNDQDLASDFETELVNTTRAESSKRKFLDNYNVAVEKVQSFEFDSEEEKAKLIENISGGLALSGIFLTKHIPELCKQRSQLVKFEGNAQLTHPVSECNVFIKEFHSLAVRDEFNKMVSAFTFETANEFQKRMLSSCKNVLVSRTDENDEKFYSKSLYYVVPIKEWDPNFSEISMSDEAVSSLCSIESYLENNESSSIIKECQQFFDEFGSHFYKGKIYFGAVFCIEVGCENRLGIDLFEVKTNIQEKFSLALKNLFHERGFHCESEITGQNTVDDDCGIQGKAVETAACSSDNISIFTKFVPNKVAFPHWKHSLFSHPEQWSVVGKGKLNMRDYIGIWELVKFMPCAFKNARKLSGILEKEWSRITELKEVEYIFDVLVMRNNMEIAVESLQASSTTGDSLQMLKTMTNNILSTKQLIWQQELTTNNVASNFLTFAIRDIPCNCEKNGAPYFIEILVEFSGNADFPHKNEICKWLQEFKFDRTTLENDFDNVDDLVSSIRGDYLRTARNKVELFKGYTKLEEALNESITFSVENVCVKTLKRLSEKIDPFEFMLLLQGILPLAFDIKNMKMKESLSIEKLEFFITEYEKNMRNLKRLGLDDVLKKQAWVIKLLFSQIRSVQGTDNHPMMISMISEVREFTQKLPFELTIRAIFFEANILEYENTMMTLDKIILEEKMPPTDHIGTTWSYFEDRPKQFFELPQRNNICIPASPSPSEDLLDILNAFSILTYYPEKITLQNVLAVRDIFIDEDLLKEMSDVPWIILRKIISIDSDCRERVLSNFFDKQDDMNGDQFISDEEGDLLAYLQDEKESGKMVSEATRKYHPMDVMFALLRCCDPFLKRVIYEKMNICKFAVPLLYMGTTTDNNTLTLSIWPLRNIFVDECSESVASQPLRTVSFIKVGSGSSKSKSKLANEFLRKQNEEHNTFYHRNCELGSEKRFISNGIVEATWYIPNMSEKEEVIKWPLAVYNLRGDSCLFPKQVEFILSISQVTILLISPKDMIDERNVEVLSKVHGSDTVVLLVTNLQQADRALMQNYKDKIELDPTKVRLIPTHDKQGREIDSVDLRKKLVSTIVKELDKRIPEYGLDYAYKRLASRVNIQSDEMNRSCFEGKKLCKTIAPGLTIKQNLWLTKTEVVRLQGNKFWHKWSKIQREFHKMGKCAGYDTNESIQKKMTEIRKQQIDSCNEGSDTMAKIVEILLLHIENENVLMYFIMYLKDLLDRQSKIAVSKYRSEYTDTCNSLSEIYFNTEEDLKMIDEKLDGSHFTVQHIFREIGQIYEAFTIYRERTKCKIEEKTECVLNKLPAIAAKLLLLGQPFELMDGSTVNVPLTWIKSVFNELGKLMARQKVLSVAVIGVQSSGKSTLLNTMFGLQFSTNAGQCTKGIQMQLVPVNSKSLEYDHVLIIDTE